MATIGRAAAVAELRGWKLSGLLAWLAWLLVHVLFLVSYRSRVAVLLQWAYHYSTYERGARLITATAAFPSEGAPGILVTLPPARPGTAAPRPAPSAVASLPTPPVAAALHQA